MTASAGSHTSCAVTMTTQSEATRFFREGQSYRSAEPPDLIAAERAFRAAIGQSPQWGEPYHCLGFVLQQQGRLPEAEDACARAVSLLKGDPRPLIALGNVQRLRGRYHVAIRSLEAGVALKPHYAEADARLMLAEALVGAKKLKEAADQWRIVAKMEPFYPSYEWPMEEAKRKLTEHNLEI